MAVGLLDGLAEELSALDSALLLLSGDANRSAPTPDQVARMPMDAAIFAMCGSDDDPLLDHFVGRGIPVVAVDGPHRPDIAVLDDFSLTTAEQPIVDKGRVAGRMVTDFLSGRRPENVRLPVRMRIGTTSGPPPIP